MSRLSFQGPLLSRTAAEVLDGPVFRSRIGTDTRDPAWREMRRWWRSAGSRLGPTAAARAVFDRAAAPLVVLLGYASPAAGSHGGMLRDNRPSRGPGTLSTTLVEPASGTTAGLVVTSWGEDLGREWRRAARLGIHSGSPWSLCCNGTHLRIVDARRTFARRFVEFDLEAAALDDNSFALFWALAHARALRPVATRPPHRSLLDEVAALSDRLSSAGAESLQRGVHDALTALTSALIPQGRPAVGTLTAAFNDSLTLVYRWLFLLFAEARGLVPRWHPLYREAYALSTLRGDSLRPDRTRGLWEALQATARLSLTGCSVAGLQVTAFNGPLFAPGAAPTLETSRVSDAAAARALASLTTQSGSTGRTLVSFGDFDVEQLGAVYERVLDFTPQAGDAASASRVKLERHPVRRKTTGAFYTPRSLTEYLVRRTLGPLVAGRMPDRILDLRILDPAVGSGAFLVAACRYLAAAYESALRECGEAVANEIGEPERAEIRRRVARRCLYGVDINPTAVHIARLSLWLATLSADRPLTFLDHRLRTGDSLIGASLLDLTRPPGRRRVAHRRPAAALPLFERSDLNDDLRAALPDRYRLAEDPDDSVDAVRRKARTMAGLSGPDSPMARWRAAADLWCACWAGRAGTAALAAAYPDILAGLLRNAGSLPERMAGGFLGDVARLARGRSFFHWPLEFPEIFFDRDGRPHVEAGFDAVLSNPPWDMLRADLGDADTREALRTGRDRDLEFVRRSGVYRAQATGHPNRYQLFIERAAGLTRPGGRLGLIVPWSFATDHGSAPLRQWLFQRAEIDDLVLLENRLGIFPVHRSVRFALMTATADRPTRVIRCRPGGADTALLDTLPDNGPDPVTTPPPVLMSRAFLERVSGEGLALPDLRSPLDVAIVSRLIDTHPRLSAPDGWCVRFGRELNATEDRHRFVPPAFGTLPVIEGKQIQPFRIDRRRCRWALPSSAAAALPRSAAGATRPRLAFREVAASTNRLTLIAAIVPAGAVTTHTVLCLKTPLRIADQHYLCGMFNSFVANYLVRLRVGCHVTAAVVAWLPMPRPSAETSARATVQACAERLCDAPDDRDAYVSLQAAAAHLFGVTRVELTHILDTFPLVDGAIGRAVLAAFGPP